MKPTLKIRAIRFTIALLLSLPVVAARAANLWWDPVPGTAGPGDAVGNWGVNANNTNWWSSSANVPWNNANLDTAVVGFNTGTATTITLSNKVLVGGIIFSNVGSAAYTIAAASTTSIPLANATNILFTGVSPTVTLAAHDVTHAQVADVISASVIATNGLSVSANTGTTNGFLRFGNITNSIVGNLYVGTPGNAVYGGTGGLFCDMNTPTATDPYLSIANNLTNVTVYSNATFRISNHNSGSPANIVWPKRITMSGFGRNGINGAWVITGNVGDNFVTDLVLAGDSLIDINAGAANKVFTLYGVISGSGNLSVVSANSTANRHTLVLTNASTFVGNMNVGGGTTLQLIGGNNRLPATAAVALGMSSMPVATWNAYGRLVLGSASGVINQTIAGLSSDSSAPLCWVVGGNGTTASLLTVNSGASNFFAGSVGGTAVADKNIGIILTGGGTLTLAGTNSANGGFTASSGSIEFGDGFTDNPFSGNITNNSSVAFNVASSQTLAQLITGSGTVTKKGFGMLTLTGTNNYSGATTVSSGTLSLTTAKSGTGAINVGTGLELDIKRHVAGAKITAASATFDTDTVKMDFNLKGPNATPLLDVTGALMNTGTMNIYVQNAGILTVGSYALIKYSSLVDGGGSAFNLAAPISPRVTATINNNTITKTVELVVTAVDLMKWTGSTDNVWDTTTTNWMLTGASTPINYADGELIYFDDTGANPAINLTTSAFPGMMTLSNTTTTYSISGSGTLGGSGTLVKAGSGSLTLGIPGANQSGGTIVQGGTLTLGDGSTDCSVSASIENNSLLVFNVLSANNPSAISGTGSLTKQGAGDFTLDEANSYGGATTVTAGRVHVLDSTAFGSAASGTTVASGAEVWLDAGGLNVPEPLTIGGTGLGTAGALNIGVLMNSTWSGRITASADTLFTADLNSVLNLSDSVLGGANNLLFAAKPGAYFVASSNVTARGVFLGALPGDVAAGGLHLSGPNETLTNVQVQLPVASGATPPATAGLFARHNFALGTNSTVVLTNDQHIGDTGTRLSLDNNVTIPPGVKLVAWCPGAGAEGPGGYRCTLSVRTTTTNTWNGPIIIHGVDPSLSPTSLFTLFGGDSVGGGGLIVNGNITLGDGVANLLVRGFSGSGAINGVISLGTNFFATADGSPWTIGSTGNTWAETQIGGSGMALNVGQNNALCTSAPVRLATGSPANALDLQGHNQQVAGLYSLTGTGMTVRNSSTNSDSTLKVLSNAGSNWVYSGTIASVPAASPLHLDVAGDTLTLASAGNNYAGNTTIRSGATLALSGSGNITASPIIDVQAGGTFAVSGTTSGGWTAAAGQSVKGNGTITGNLGVSGTVAPGESVGALNVTGDVTMNGSGAIVMEVNNSAATNDLLNVSGTLAYGGTLLVTNISGTPYVNGQVIKLFNAGTYSGSFVNIIVPGASSYNASNLTVNGTITVSSASTGPVSITFSPTAGGTALDLSWPPDHIGWRLQNQTNSLNGAWSDVPGSTTTNHVIMPVVKVNPTVFFRLKSP
jgi:autotransporter-associated beta strand protein